MKDFPQVDAYVLFDFMKEMSASEISITFKDAYDIATSNTYMPLIEYSLDRIQYHTLGETDNNYFTYSGDNINFRYLKFTNNIGAILPHWVSFAEITII